MNADEVVWFERYGNATGQRNALARINKYGQVVLNGDALSLTRYRVDAFRVGTTYDELGNLLIVLQPSTRNDSQAFKVNRQGRQGYLSVGRFLVGEDLEHLFDTLISDVEADEESGFLFFAVPADANEGTEATHD